MAQAAAVDAPYAKLEQLEPGIARVLAHNPSAFTYYGTQTYLIGDTEVAVIDPGPDLPEHLDALERGIGGRRVVAIMCTHTHRDHSPAARPLAERDRRADHRLRAARAGDVGPRADAAFDGDYAPDRVLEDGEAIEVDGKPVIAVATPGHTSNHLCFAYRRRAVHRRPCDGLVDDRCRAARWRHGRLHAKPRQAAAARRPRSIIPRTGRR